MLILLLVSIALQLLLISLFQASSVMKNLASSTDKGTVNFLAVITCNEYPPVRQ